LDDERSFVYYCTFPEIASQKAIKERDFSMGRFVGKSFSNLKKLEGFVKGAWIGAY